ncbi:pentapeptide repeat-containing protein [Stenomitos frigidus]|nr:pentapeptide repeat-containing protein [Stenomitos frigidus]
MLFSKIGRRKLRWLTALFISVAFIILTLTKNDFRNWTWITILNANRSADLTKIEFLGKSIWDWMELLIVPLLLASGGFAIKRFLEFQAKRHEKYLNVKEEKRKQLIEEQEKARRRQEEEIALNRLHQEALKGYIEQIARLFLDMNGLEEDKVKQRAIIRARTLVALQELDGFRKGLLIRFLKDSTIINEIDLSYSDLSGANLGLINLSGINLSGANLDGADLRRADLRRIDLHNANLCNANLSLANLHCANLRYANLCNADLSDSNLDGADLRLADLRQADLRDANLKNSDLRVADLSAGELESLNCAEALILSFLEGCDSSLFLECVGLEKADIDDAFYSTKLYREKLRVADFREARINHTTLDGEPISEAIERYVRKSWGKLDPLKTQNEEYKGANLHRANLGGALLQLSNFSGADMSDINLNHANLSHASLYAVNLANADLSDSIIHFTKLGSANIRNADLNNADFNEANLSNADLSGSSWHNINLTGTNLFNTIFIETKITIDQLKKAKICNTKLPCELTIDCDRDCMKPWQLGIK